MSKYVRELEDRVGEQRAVIAVLRHIREEDARKIKSLKDRIVELEVKKYPLLPNITQFELDIIINDLLCLKERLPS